MQFDQLKRRDFITLIGGAAAAWPLAARAQQPAMPVIGFLGSASPDLWASRLRAFHQGLSEAGYIEGRNVAVEYRWSENHFERLPALAADLVRRGVSVIAVPGSTTASLAAKAATATVPIVFFNAVDPVASGLVASLARPGGNATGGTPLSIEVGPKRLELLREVVPTATSIALLVNPASPALSQPAERDLETAARALALKLHVVRASSEGDFETVFASLTKLRADGLVIGPDALFSSRSEALAGLALRHALPAIYQFEFAAAGGLMSYGGSYIDGFRLAGTYSARILNGEKPADLPVQQSTKVELIINLRTARALGLDIPPTLLARADEVIE
jgi:putative tryptophan/tyrosine transport system substrate-binding protein